jgi:DNA-binding transcriptional MerR regulator
LRFRHRVAAASGEAYLRDMTDEPLLTLRQVAQELALPESTVRYYRDAFLDHIPSVGTGRRRRYPPPAVAVLRSIAQGYAAGRSHERILHGLDGMAPRPADVSLPPEQPRERQQGAAEVSNLELLAAIVDGEREQRDALWHMAKEIVRLTEVLEGQERVLTEIADHAGVSGAGQPVLGAGAGPTRALGEGRAASAPAAEAGTARATVTAVPAAPPPATAARVTAFTPAATPDAKLAATGSVSLFGSKPLHLEEPPPAPPPGPGAVRKAAAPPPDDAARGAGAMPVSDMERLRTELDMERQLVERLREAKVKLEHRVTDAEDELEERRRKRSVLGRILKPGERE